MESSDTGNESEAGGIVAASADDLVSSINYFRPVEKGLLDKGISHDFRHDMPSLEPACGMEDVLKKSRLWTAA